MHTPVTKNENAVVSPASYSHYKTAGSCGKAAYNRHLLRYPGDLVGARKRNAEAKEDWKNEKGVYGQATAQNSEQLKFLQQRARELLKHHGSSLQQHLTNLHAEYKEHLQAEQKLQQTREEFQASEPAPGSGMNTEETAKPDGPQAMAAPVAAAAEVTTQVTVVVLFFGL